jgi:citrate lyase subunit beta/citryl-CoA lyase
MVAALPRHVGVRLPKAESVEGVRQVSADAPDRPVHLLVESALGLERAYDLATATSDVASIGLGEADLRADLGVEGDDGLLWARGRIVAAAAAAGLAPPAMAVFTDIRDLDGLAASCRAGRALGFLGRTAIHPAQLEVIRAAFTPTDAEVARAREILAAADQASKDGHGAVALADGRFVDAAVLRQARRVVALAG